MAKELSKNFESPVLEPKGCPYAKGGAVCVEGIMAWLTRGDGVTCLGCQQTISANGSLDADREGDDD